MSPETFHKRLAKLIDTLKKHGSAFADAEALAVFTGKIDQDEDIGYLKSYALFTWLFGDELQNTLLYVTKEAVKIVCDSKDAAQLLKLSGKATESSTKHPPVTVIGYKSGAAATAVKPLPKSLGGLPKEEHDSEMVKEFKSAVEKAGATTAAISEGLSLVMNVKDESEVKLVKTASTLTCAVFKSFLQPQIEDILDKDKKISHSKLSEKVENCILEPKMVKLKQLNANLCDPCYPPIIQSGGAYDLRPSAQSNDKKLEAGCIVASLGARYANYCSNATRTYLIDATDEQEKIYEALLAAQAAAIKALKPGKKLSSVYQTVKESLDSSKSGLSENLMKNVGFGMGIEYRDASFVLNAKNEKKIEAGSVFNVAVGLQNLKDKTNGVWAAMIADTVLVQDKEAEVLTAACRKSFKSISYNMQDEDEAEEDEVVDDHRLLDDTELQNGSRRSRHAKSASEQAEAAAEADQRRKHQEELAKKKLEEGKARLERGANVKKDEGEQEKRMDQYQAYKNATDYPKNMKPRQIHVDMDNEAILLPINGVPVPFHISTVKNVGKIDDEENSYLRINFHFPSGATQNPASRAKTEQPKFPDAAKDFIKEVTFRSANSVNINDTVRKIRELRRRFSTKLQEEQQPETVIQQDTLVLDRSGGRRPHLPDVAVRPPMFAGKANKGILEAHTNGFRFRTIKGVNLDVIYSNIKHAFFQEAKNEVIVLLHLNLKNPIIIKNKKTTDVQFYIEVMESAVKLNESRRRAFDQDELVAEQREREMRNRMNNTFLKFTKEMEDKYNLEFDAPYRELGFHGAPKNAGVFLMPTVSCIVSLVDWPPFILSLQDVEIAYLERVAFSLRNFDIVFIFKSFLEDTTKGASWSRISSIPTEELEPLKKFLNEQEIKYYEGSKNLVWDNILSNIREDYEDFVQNGGWGFLDSEDEGSEREQEDELDEGDEVFEPEIASDDDAASDDDSDAYEESDDSGDAAEELGGDSDAGEEDLSSDEEGLDWDELEKNAAKDDKEKFETQQEDDRRGKKPQRPPQGKSSGIGSKRSRR